MVKYNPKILQKYAEILYRQASSVVLVCTIVGVVIGIGPAVSLGEMFAAKFIPFADRSTVTVLLAVVITFAFGIIGYLVGQAIAFWYRLKAQLTLCQKQIEYNTRYSAEAKRPQSLQFEEILP